MLSEVNINVSDGIRYIDSLYSIISLALIHRLNICVSRFQTSLCMGQICCTVHSCIKFVFIKDPETLVCNRYVNSEGQTNLDIFNVSFNVNVQTVIAVCTFTDI